MLNGMTMNGMNMTGVRIGLVLLMIGLVTGVTGPMTGLRILGTGGVLSNRYEYIVRFARHLSHRRILRL